MDWLTFSIWLIGLILVALAICVGAHIGIEAVKAWREVRLADAENLRHAVDVGQCDGDEPHGEVVLTPSTRTAGNG